MDVEAKLDQTSKVANWADLMDEMLRENFETKASAWTRHRTVTHGVKMPPPAPRDIEVAVPA